MSASIEKLSKLEDRLYGKNRRDQIDKVNKKLKERIDLLNKEKDLVNKQLTRIRDPKKKTDLSGNYTVSYYAGLVKKKVNFDKDNNNITNGKDIEEAFVKRINNRIKDYNKVAEKYDTIMNDSNSKDSKKTKVKEQLDAAKEKVDKAKTQLEGFKEAFSYYHEQLSLSEDIKNNIIDEKQTIQDKNDAIVDAIQQGIEDVLNALDKGIKIDKIKRE